MSERDKNEAAQVVSDFALGLLPSDASIFDRAALLRAVCENMLGRLNFEPVSLDVFAHGNLVELDAREADHFVLHAYANVELWLTRVRTPFSLAFTQDGVGHRTLVLSRGFALVGRVPQPNPAAFSTTYYHFTPVSSSAATLVSCQGGL